MKSFFTVFILVVIFALATTSIAQTDWTKYPDNPVMVKGSAGSWDDLNVGLACVILVGDTYHMWYDANWDDPGITNTGIGHATSFDGIEWQKDVANPVFLTEPKNSWESHTVTQTSVLYNDLDSLFYMWYAGYGPGDDDTGIGLAISPDGTNWTRDTLHNPVLSRGSSGSWDDILLLAPCVIRIDGIYHMWYDGWQDGSSVHQIGHATSADGITWQKDPTNPVFTRGNSTNWDFPEVRGAKVIYDGSRFHMFYTGGRWATYDIGYAYSQDGINWTKYSGNPILIKGPTNSWDDYGLIFASVMFNQTDDSLKMWYSGASNGASTSKIGHATAQIPLYVPDNFETIQAAIDAASDGNVVLVDEGTYYENINFKGKAITVASHYYIDGDTSHISKTIIDGSQPANPDSGSVVYFVSGEDTNSVLSGFTITGGTGTKRNFESDVEWYGGGIYCASGGRIMNNIVRNNGFDVDVVYAAGGGISAGLWGMWGTEYVIIHGNIIVSNSIMGNSECDGGGIAFFRNGRITDNIISDNSLTSDVNWGTGGGIAVGSLCENPNIVVAGNQIINNKITGIDGAYGGGIIIGYCDVPVTNNIISGNIASLGGGICLNTSNSEIINNTIANNTASSQGGGLYVLTNSNFVVLNTIFWNNEATNDSQIYGSGDVLYSDIQGGWEGKGNIDADPQFLDTLLYIIPESSPCVDAGYDSSFFNDIEDEGNLGFAKWPAMGTLINDLGAYGGPHEYDAIELRDVIDYILDVPDKNMNYPIVFNLSQNYPNPFNPITNIDYRIPNTEFVILEIYNLLGQKVVTLVSERQKAGNHKVEWDAGQMASGVYYYQFKAGEFQDVKKMILLR